MRRLVLFRHAKADPHEHGTKLDHHRGLTKRGRNDAALVGKGLAQAHLVPDLALVSDSTRTKETFAIAGKALGRDMPVRFEPTMYRAEPEGLLALIRDADDSAGTLLLIGHNPEFAALAADLVGSGDVQALARMRSKFPTAAAAVIDFDVEHWSEVAERQGRLDRFLTPALLGGGADD